MVSMSSGASPVVASPGLLLPGIAAVVIALGAGTWSYLFLRREGSEDRKPKMTKESKAHLQDNRLREIYDNIEQSLAVKGLNEDVVKSFRQFFTGLGAVDANCSWGSPWPAKYAQLHRPAGPLEFPTVRLLVIPLEDSPSLVAKAAAATRDVVAALPPGDMFFNSRGNYHITMFHTSGLFDPITNPFVPGGGVPEGAPPCDRQRTTDADLEKELQMLERLAASTPPPVLEVDRIAFADSGVLLMLCFEAAGDSVLSIRARGKEMFPGMPAKQPDIIHVSLMRYLKPGRLTEDQVELIQTTCQRWTEKMRGTRFVPRNLWFVHEEEFSTIVGKRHVLPLGS